MSQEEIQIYKKILKFYINEKARSLHIYLPINSISQSIYNTTQKLITNRNIHNGASSLYNVTLLDEFVITEHHDTNVIWLQVQSHTLGGEDRDLIKSSLII